jgi:hypothetical protein
VSSPAVPAPSFLFDANNFLHVARGFAPPELVRAFRRRAQEGLRQHLDDSLDERNARAVARGEAPDAVRLDQEWYAVWRQANRTSIGGAAAAFPCVIYPPQVRLVTTRKSWVPWHQDAAYQKLLGPRGHAHSATCFLPLEEDPSACPTIEFAVQPHQELLAHGPGSGFGCIVDAAAVGEDAQRVRFDLRIGDALFFGDHVLHRTFYPADEFPPRLSIEFRLTDDAHLIEGKDYYDVRAQRFFVRS